MAKPLDWIQLADDILDAEEDMKEDGPPSFVTVGSKSFDACVKAASCPRQHKRFNVSRPLQARARFWSRDD